MSAFSHLLYNFSRHIFKWVAITTISFWFFSFFFFLTLFPSLPFPVSFPIIIYKELDVYQVHSLNSCSWTNYSTRSLLLKGKMALMMTMKMMEVAKIVTAFIHPFVVSMQSCQWKKKIFFHLFLCPSSPLVKMLLTTVVMVINQLFPLLQWAFIVIFTGIFAEKKQSDNNQMLLLRWSNVGHIQGYALLNDRFLIPQRCMYIVDCVYKFHLPTLISFRKRHISAKKLDDL